METLSISLTEQEAAFLKEFASKQYEGAKDNLGTRTPIHVVERLERVFSADEDGDAWVYTDCDANICSSYPDFDSMIADINKKTGTLPPYAEVEYKEVNGVWIDNYQSYLEAYEIEARNGHFIDTYRPVAFFLIRDEAIRFMSGYQKHNCEDCRIYTYGLGYSNEGDLPVFRNLLLNLGKQLNEGGTI